MNKKNKMIENDIEQNKKNDVDKEIKTIQKAIRRRRQKNRIYRDLSLRFNELNNSETEPKNKIEALKQTVSHIEEVNDEVKLKIKEFKKIKNIHKENLFDFTDYVKKQKEDVEIDDGLFLKLAEENKIIYNHTPVNTMKEDMEILKNGIFMNGYFSLDDEGEIDTNGFFKIVMNYTSSKTKL